MIVDLVGQRPPPLVCSGCLNDVVFIQVFEFGWVQSGASLGQCRQFKLKKMRKWTTERDRLTEAIMSDNVIIAVLSGAFPLLPVDRDEEDRGSVESCGTPHPAKANQLRTA